ncbi:hypothetical protein [Paenibacillus amylolyticus]|uniref:hypothetical protein n=1 Tax=Paenibacillus amylolyticus TaxID=1451 RepID=UPI003D95BA6B
MEYNFLHDKHWETQDYLLYIYDVIADMPRKADQYNLTSVTLKFDNEEAAHSFESAEDMFDWMDKNGYHETSVKMFVSHMFFSLLSDFCFYLYESLSCAERGKVSVAYSLLRKPIRDNLLYLEWLLDDSEEFYSTFMTKSAEQYDVASKKIFDESRIQKIMDSAAEKTYMGENLNKNNLVYTLRFNNKELIGLPRIWSQSMHLVTTFSRNYLTAQGNLNFIFADSDNWNEYWDYYYLVMPMLITYSLEICEALFISITDVTELELLFNRSVRYAKYGKISPDFDSAKKIEKEPYKILDLAKETGTNIFLTCDHCNKRVLISHELMNGIINNWSIKCTECLEELSVCKYILGIEVTENNLI